MQKAPTFFAPDDDARACLRALSSLLCRDGKCLCVDPAAGVALDLAGDAVFVVDIQRRILYFNDRASQMTGFRADEVLGARCRDGLHCADCDAGCALFGEGPDADRHLEIRTQSGVRKLVVKDARVLRDAAGRVVGGVETLHDVTDVHRAREESIRRVEMLQARCRFLEAFAANLAEGMAAVDREGRLLCLSTRAAELLGIPTDCESSLRIQDLVSDGLELMDRMGFVLATRGRAEMVGILPTNPVAASQGTLSLRLSPLDPD
ncbi:MAG TPA: PAS domain-containing protein, partial [Myxococcota bacterium]|nr:PAS domain-containing protein [Myxococcota bacterium]